MIALRIRRFRRALFILLGAIGFAGGMLSFATLFPLTDLRAVARPETVQEEFAQPAFGSAVIHPQIVQDLVCALASRPKPRTQNAVILDRPHDRLHTHVAEAGR